MWKLARQSRKNFKRKRNYQVIINQIISRDLIVRCHWVPTSQKRDTCWIRGTFSRDPMWVTPRLRIETTLRIGPSFKSLKTSLKCIRRNRVRKVTYITWLRSFQGLWRLQHLKVYLGNNNDILVFLSACLLHFK